MPVHAEYREAAITLRLVGEYALSELKEAFLAALPAPPASVRGVIIDVSQSVSVRRRPASDVRGISQWWGTQGQLFQRRLALVAHVGTVEYGMARLSAIEAESAGLTVEVFGDEAAARLWIANDRH